MAAGKPPSGDRDELVRLVQLLVTEGQRIGQVFARRHGLHPTDVEALLRIMLADRDGHPLTAGELAAELGLTSGSVTTVVDRLERVGHVTRERDHTDRRRVILHHDASGLELAQAFFVPLGALHRTVTDDFTAAELATVRRYLAATTEVFRGYREDLDR